MHGPPPLFYDVPDKPAHPIDALDAFNRRVAALACLAPMAGTDCTNELMGGVYELYTDLCLLRTAMLEWFRLHHDTQVPMPEVFE